MRRYVVYVVTGVVLLCIFYSGCVWKETPTDMEYNKLQGLNIEEDDNEESCNDDLSQTRETGSETTSENEKNNDPGILIFRDVFGEEYSTEINPDVPAKPYNNDLFRHEGKRMSYDDSSYDSILGIDVSHHQGVIDWDKVKEQGYEFAFLRIAYRGYGKDGLIKSDLEFTRNLINAHKAGIDIGVYFFSQAVNENEAKEEAEFVLQCLSGNDIELPVVYDPESILDAEARTDNVSGEQFTRNTIVFCNTVHDAGYQPMIYSNMLWEAFELNLEELKDIPIWYADYEDVPQTPYDFEFWQYSNEGHVEGIDGEVDLDIWIRGR